MPSKFYSFKLSSKKRTPSKLGLKRVSPRSIVAIRGERGSYNRLVRIDTQRYIVAIRGERGSYNYNRITNASASIVAIRGERGSYNSA